MAIESTPDSGVETRNAADGPRPGARCSGSVEIKELIDFHPTGKTSCFYDKACEKLYVLPMAKIYSMMILPIMLFPISGFINYSKNYKLIMAYRFIDIKVNYFWLSTR